MPHVLTRASHLGRPARWAPLTRGLVAPEWRWAWRDLELAIPFWDFGSSFLTDYGKNRLGAVLAGGASWKMTDIGPAIEFDGGDGEVDFDDVLDLTSPAKGLTIRVIGKPISWGNFNYPLIQKFGTAGNYRVDNDSTGGTLNLSVRNAGGDIETLTSSASLMPNGSWADILCTYDDHPTGNKTGRIYKNGVLDAEKTDFTVVRGNTAEELRIGHSRINAKFWNGQMALLTQWSQVLDAAEVAKLALDPWGMFRMEDQSYLMRLVVAGNPWYAYAQM